MKVLLTGGSGFLGSHIAEQLAAQGDQVVALVRRTSNLKFLSSLPGVELAFGSVEDRDSVLRAAEGVDGIIHSAGLVKARNPAEFEGINVGGTRNLLDAARQQIARLTRFVYVSSLTAFGPSMTGDPVAADHTPNPVTHYGRSKLKGERVVLDAKDELPVVVIRPPMIYGPRDNESFAFFQTVSRRVLPFIGNGKNKLSIVYGADAASACIRALQADIPSGRSYFVDDGKVYVWRDMLEELEVVLKRRAFLRFSIPLPVLHGAALASEGYGRWRNKAVMLTRDKLNELTAPHWVCESSETRRELGWEPKVDWTAGARLAADWYRQAGWL